MKLAYFTDSYLPTVDGVVRSILDMRAELQPRGHEVYVFTTGSKQEIRSERDSHVFRYRSFNFPPYPQYKIALFPYYSTRKKIRQLSPDLIHCHTMATMGIAGRDAAVSTRLPSIGTFNTLLPKGIQTITRRKWTRGLGEAVLWKAMDWFYEPFDVITSPSAAIKALLEGRDMESVVVPNGVDTQRLHPVNKNTARRRIASKIGLAGDEKIILWAGRQSKEKNIDVLIRAFALVARQENARFVLTGEGPGRKELEALSRKLGYSDWIRFLGFVPEKELFWLYNAADVYAIASTFETQGLAPLEAMACGTPVVGADSLAIPEVVQDGRSGYLFEPFDVEECSRKLLKVLQASPAKGKALSKGSRRMAEKFSLPRVAAQWLKLYEKVA